ncbi:hypothetical protein ACNOYE_29005 [Nannocystaceae bacterium ST9]
MRWDAAIFGRLVIPASQRKAWLAADLDWKSVEGHEVLKGYISGESVADIVEGVNFSESSEFLDIGWTGDELRLASFQSQAGFTESMVGFAAAWAASARFGAGELIGMGMVGARFGYRVTVGEGKVAIAKVPDDQLEALAQHPDAVALRERMATMGPAMAAKLVAAAAPVPAGVPRPAAASIPVKVATAPVEKVTSADKPAAKKKATAKKAAAKKT